MAELLSKIKFWLSRFIKSAYYWRERKHANEAAALAFYSLFSFIPILLIGLFVAALIVGRDTATSSLLEQTHKVTGFSTSDYLRKALSGDIKSFGSTFSPLIGVFILVFSATKVINEMRRALSNIFGNPRYKKHSQAAMSNLIGRILSLTIILVLGLVIASSVISESIINLLKEQLIDSYYLAQVFNYLSPIATFSAMAFLAAVIMRWLPKRPPKIKEAIYGGLVCSALIVALKYGLIIFIHHANISSIFGGAITLVLLLLWVYFAMQALLYSAEFTAILAKERRAGV